MPEFVRERVWSSEEVRWTCLARGEEGKEKGVREEGGRERAHEMISWVQWVESAAERTYAMSQDSPLPQQPKGIIHPRVRSIPLLVPVARNPCSPLETFPHKFPRIRLGEQLLGEGDLVVVLAEMGLDVQGGSFGCFGGDEGVEVRQELGGCGYCEARG
jgi:hypothetical protein